MLLSADAFNEKRRGTARKVEKVEFREFAGEFASSDDSLALQIFVGLLVEHVTLAVFTLLSFL
jgi:hypothetical protein